MKLNRIQLRRLIIEAISEEKQCVSDSHPAVIALKKAISASGIKYDEGTFDFADTSEAEEVLGAPLLNIYDDIDKSTISGMRAIVSQVERKYPDVKFAWASLGSSVGGVNGMLIYAKFADDMTMPTSAETFEDLTSDLARAKAQGYGC